MSDISMEQVKLAGELLKREHLERLRLEKVAQDNEQEKRATKVAFREVELGLSEPFKSYAEMQEKVASLLTDNLDVVEKALERGYGSVRKVAELDTSTSTGKKLNAFEDWVLNGSLE